MRRTENVELVQSSSMKRMAIFSTGICSDSLRWTEIEWGEQSCLHHDRLKQGWILTSHNHNQWGQKENLFCPKLCDALNAQNATIVVYGTCIWQNPQRYWDGKTQLQNLWTRKDVEPLPRSQEVSCMATV